MLSSPGSWEGKELQAQQKKELLVGNGPGEAVVMGDVPDSGVRGCRSGGGFLSKVGAADHLLEEAGLAPPPSSPPTEMWPRDFCLPPRITAPQWGDFRHQPKWGCSLGLLCLAQLVHLVFAGSLLGGWNGVGGQQ